MSNVSIVDQLREMRLSAMAKEFEAQAQEAKKAAEAAKAEDKKEGGDDK